MFYGCARSHQTRKWDGCASDKETRTGTPVLALPQAVAERRCRRSNDGQPPRIEIDIFHGTWPFCLLFDCASLKFGWFCFKFDWFWNQIGSFSSSQVTFGPSFRWFFLRIGQFKIKLMVLLQIGTRYLRIKMDIFLEIWPFRFQDTGSSFHNLYSQ